MLNQPTYYIYRHVRRDTDQIFYIGKGTILRPTHNFKRAFETRNRNLLWRRIVNKTAYDVEIVMEFASRDACVAKEKEFITLYGRIDLRRGTLANLTDGGDGSWGLRVSEQERRRRSEAVRGEHHPNFGKKLSAETCRRKSEAVKGARHYLFGKKLPDRWRENIRRTKFGSDNPMHGKPSPQRKRVRNMLTGAEYPSIKTAAEAEGYSLGALYQWLDGTNPNKSNLVIVN
jgi:hypothetical protein